MARLTSFIVASAFVVGCSGADGSAVAPPHDGLTAYLICQDFVEDRLRAPATAEFPSYRDQGVDAEVVGPAQYRIGAYVDSQNGFGAMLRTAFSCTVTWESGTTWRLNDLNLD